MKISLITFIICSTMFLGACAVDSEIDNNNQEVVTPQETATITESTMPSNTIDQLAPPVPGDTVATIETTMGTIKAKLFTDNVPETTKNFVELANQGKYNEVPFHRVIEDFMIQTGDFENQNGTGGYSYLGEGTRFEDEFDPELKHQKYTLSMANSGPDTNGSQFFIVSANGGTHWLNGKHSVFGQVYEGQDVVDAIQSMETLPGDKPAEDVLMTSVTISTL